MAPCMTIQKAAGQAENEIRRLRKPVIEKMRRDRINSSIEQLRILLEKEFQKHQLPSKPEKADILELTVTFLQQHLAGRYVTRPSQTSEEEYCQRVQSSANYLSVYDQRHQNKLMKHSNTHQTASQELSHGTMYSSHSSVESIQTDRGQLLHNNRKSLWRPW